MTNKSTIERLTEWIEDIKEAARDDTSFSIAWFPETEDKQFSIIAGWQKIPGCSNSFCCSKSHPEYVMCVKIAKNEDKTWYLDFDSMNMPTDKFGNVDDTCVPLEWDDPAEAAAPFFLCEWERIMNEYMED
jgi:hypothetical protein